MKKTKYAKRLAIYSIVFGCFSFIGNFGLGPNNLSGGATIAVFVLVISFIITGSIINSRIKKNNHDIKIPYIILMTLWLLMELPAIPMLFVAPEIFLVYQLFTIFPLYSGAKYFLIQKQEKADNEPLTIKKE